MAHLTITGVSRSGTGYMSKLLNECGVKCGHEQIYTIKGVEKNDLQADCSWLAVPHLKSPSVLLVRHPLKVIKSITELGTFQESSVWTEPIKNFSPIVYTYETTEDRVLAYWYYWNMYALSKSDLILSFDKINLGNLNRVLKLGGFQPAKKFPRVGIVNDKKEQKHIKWDGDWSSFDPKLARLAQKLWDNVNDDQEIKKLNFL